MTGIASDGAAAAATAASGAVQPDRIVIGELKGQLDSLANDMSLVLRNILPVLRERVDGRHHSDGRGSRSGGGESRSRDHGGRDGGPDSRPSDRARDGVSADRPRSRSRG